MINHHCFSLTYDSPLLNNWTTIRNLPHLFFVRALEATLHGLSKIEPGATVDVAVMTEGRWGGLVDEVGMPVDWDIPKHICSQLGLHCIQVTENS